MKKPQFLRKYGFGELAHFQSDHKRWVDYNFPNENDHSPLLGLAEEVGELAHAHLKNEQCIRGNEAEHRRKAADAIGDIMIYLTSYCNRNGYELDMCLLIAWNEIKDRDWVNYPETGKPTSTIEGPPVNTAAKMLVPGEYVIMTKEQMRVKEQNEIEVARNLAETRSELGRMRRDCAGYPARSCPLKNQHTAHNWLQPHFLSDGTWHSCPGVPC